MNPFQRETFTAEIVDREYIDQDAPTFPMRYIRIGNAAGTAMVPLDDAAGLAHWLLEAAWQMHRPSFGGVIDAD